MMIKVFTTDKDGKISLTADELKKLLDEAYWEGYNSKGNSYTWTSPNWNTPYITYTTTCSSGDCINISTTAGDSKNED